MDYNNAPGYLKGADLHNLGAGNVSFFDDPIADIGEKVGAVGEAIANTPAFAISSIASGINSIYNSGVVAGNFFGITDAKENDLQKTLSSFDSNLGEYYNANRQATDTVGFVVTSLVPGIGGIKLAQAGQRVLSGAVKYGKVGTSLAESTGLAVTATKGGLSLTEAAGQALATSGQTFSFMNAGVLKAIAGGVGKATLEAAAFEMAVQATMFRSPILENQDIKDIGANILTGTLLGGAIGGAINAAGVYGGVKKILTAADLEQKKFTLRNSQFGLEKSPADRIVVGALDLESTPALTINSAEEVLKSQRITAIEQERRTAIHELSRGDPDLGNFLADATTGMSADQITKAYQGAKVIMRPAQLGEVAEGNVAGFVRLHGDDVGEVTFDKIPSGRLNLADMVPGGKDAILKTVQSYNFNSSKPWDMITATSSLEVEVRHIWADKLAKYADGMKIGENDIPLLEGALKRGLSVNIETESGVVSYLASDLKDYLLKRKLDLAGELLEAKKATGWGFAVGPTAKDAVSTITVDDVAKAVNVSVKRLESEETASMFARQDSQAAFDKLRKDKGLTGEVDLDFIPKHAAVVYDTLNVNATGDTVAALVRIKGMQKVQQESTDKAVAAIAGELSSRLFRPGDKAVINSNRYGAGAGLVTFANGSYGSLASWAEQVGKVAADLSIKLKKDTGAILDSVLLKLRGDQAAAIEFDKIKNLVASTTEKYIVDDAGEGLIALRTHEYNVAMREGKKGVEVPVLIGGAPEKIKFISPNAKDAVIAHIEANGSRVSNNKALRASIGLEDARDPRVFYSPKPDPKTMPFFAFVKDETVTGAGMGHTSMIHASSADELERMIQMAREKTGFKVYTKKDTEDFFKAQKSYEFDRTLHDNYIDSSLKAAGINNQFFPKTDPTVIVDELARWHSRGDDMLAKEVIATKFGHEFDQLETLGQQYTNVAGSRYSVNQKVIENTALNPYNDYRKTALNISRMSEYPILSAINRTLEKGVGEVYKRLYNTYAEVKSINDLDKVNDALKSAGVSHSYASAAEIVLANHTAPKPVLSQFIRRANAILANTFLRLDPLNALNNMIGAQVLLGTETKSQVRSMLRQMEQSSVIVPGTGDRMLSASKLIAKAQSNFFTRDKGLLEFYTRNGYMSDINTQYRSMLDDLTLQGTETVADLTSRTGRALEKARRFGDFGEKVTGNSFAEEYNRFISADVARQISEMAIEKGLMTGEGMLSYINTFVNRTQGNMLASQRPLIFQGPIGQAVGLFQTFQFNVIQQLFRGISEGSMKDAAMMMGLQGTIYGLNGLPGFQYINQHIVGTASGNPNHRDAYSTVYGAAGKEAGDWLMYGIPSNLLQTNLYTRGDINPRNLTVIPVAPQDIVAVSAFAKFGGNLKETVSKIANGGDVWQSILQGIEHNGLSRPLAGLAQTLQAADGGKVFSTTNAGNISFVNDFASFATLSRLAGGRPLDESLANDEVARSMVYKAADRERMKKHAEVFKTTVIGDTTGEVTPSAVANYLEAYVGNGGNQEDFNKQMLNVMTTTNTPRANQIIDSLRGPYGEHMKSLMGGKVEELE